MLNARLIRRALCLVLGASIGLLFLLVPYKNIVLSELEYLFSYMTMLPRSYVETPLCMFVLNNIYMLHYLLRLLYPLYYTCVLCNCM